MTAVAHGDVEVGQAWLVERLPAVRLCIRKLGPGAHFLRHEHLEVGLHPANRAIGAISLRASLNHRTRAEGAHRVMLPTLS